MARRQQPGWFAAVLMAAVFGLGFVPAVDIGAGFMTATRAAGLYLTVTTAVYAAWLGRTRSPKLGAATCVIATGLLASAAFDRLLPTALALGGALAVARARLLFRREIERPWRLELCLTTAAFFAAWLVLEPTLERIALAVWTFWLVQSGFLLWVGERRLSKNRVAADPFDVAARRATELMDNL
ncbi:MAG TPA: hypothetical protein VKZ49_01585 [Polyangiaceae bacterium]|nr:hypothetical protein [Polyangiaceae bacterium]